MIGKKIVSWLILVTFLLSLLVLPSTQTVEAEEVSLAPTIFYDITGIPQDKVVMLLGQTEVSAKMYFYWFCYVCSSLEYNIISDYNDYGMHSSCIDKTTGSIDWTSDYMGMTLIEYAQTQAEETIKYYMSIEALAKEHNAGLTSSDTEDIESTFQDAVEEMGGQEAFLLYLTMLGIDKADFDRISSANYLYSNLLDLVFTKDSDIYLSDEDFAQYAIYADHILISSQDMRTGEKLPPEEVMEKYKLAEDLVDQLNDSDDLATLFDELADEFSEDPVRAQNPTGYIFTDGTMVAEFETAARLLEPGEISEIVQSDYGFHIILRRDLLTALKENESKRNDIAKAYLDELLVEKTSTSPVSYDECMDRVDWLSFYTSYVEQVDEIAAAYAKNTVQ